MITYIVVFLFILFLVVNYDIGKRKKNYNTFVDIVVVLLVLLAGLRNGVGSDTHNYAAMFYNAPTLNEVLEAGRYVDWLSQPIWYLSNTIIRTISNHFLLFQLVHAIVFNLLLLRFLRRTTTYIFTALLMIYCILWWNLSFEVLREAICVVLFLNGVLELRKNNVRKFFLWCLPGIFIHWFFFPIVLIILLINYMRPKVSVGIFAVAALSLFFIEVSVISQTIMELYGGFAGNDESSEVLQGYFQTDTLHGFSSLNIFGFAMSIILVSPYIISGVGMYKKTGNTVDIAFVILYVFFFVAQGRLVILSRYLNYIIPYVIVVLVNYYYQTQKKTLISKFLFIMMLYLSFQGYSNFKSPRAILGASEYNYYHIPYTSVFDSPAPRRVPIDY